MENTNAKPDTQQNPNNNGDLNNPVNGDHARRTPFTELNQVDADLALARTLQEQERAYMMLRMEAIDDSDYGSWETESYGHDDDVEEDDYDDASQEDLDGSIVEVDDGEGDAFDGHAHCEGEENDDQKIELDPSAFSSDEAYARALQETEERDMAARMLALAGINEMFFGEDDGEVELGDNSQDAWQEVNPDEL